MAKIKKEDAQEVKVPEKKVEEKVVQQEEVKPVEEHKVIVDEAKQV